MNELLKLLKKSNFVGKVSSLSVSSIISQSITLLNLAIMARIFVPDTIGVYSVFLSYMSIFSSIVLLSYQYSLPNLDDQNATQLTYGILIILPISCSLVMIGFYIFSYNYVFELGCIIFCGGLIALTDMLNLRDQRINLIVGKKIFSALFLTFYLVYVYFFIKIDDARILIQGNVIVNIILALIYSFTSLKNYLYPLPSFKEILNIIIQKRRDPIYLAPSTIINTMTYNLPTIFIEQYFGAAMAAQYSIVLKFCISPISLIGDSVANIYHSHVAKAVRTKSANAYNQYIALRKYLLLISIAVSFVIILFFPILIRFILGDGWDYAARFAQILAPMYGIMLFTTPLSMLFFVFNEQRFLFYIQLLYIAISFIAFGSSIYVLNIWLGIILFSALSFCRYFIIYYKIHIVADNLKYKHA